MIHQQRILPTRGFPILVSRLTARDWRPRPAPVTMDQRYSLPNGLLFASRELEKIARLRKCNAIIRQDDGRPVRADLSGRSTRLLAFRGQAIATISANE